MNSSKEQNILLKTGALCRVLKGASAHRELQRKLRLQHPFAFQDKNDFHNLKKRNKKQYGIEWLPVITHTRGGSFIPSLT